MTKSRRTPKRPIKSVSDAQITANILDALRERHLAHITVEEFQIGGRRVDFWALHTWFSKGYTKTAYEIKASRQDFLKDDRKKQANAINFSNEFYYVTPKGLVEPHEIPEWAGLIELDGTELNGVVPSPQTECAEPTWELVVSLIRGSADVRRDTALMRDQIRSFEIQEKRLRKENKELRNLFWKGSLLRVSGSTEERLEGNR